MDVKATVWNSPEGLEVIVRADGVSRVLDVPAKPTARGSAVSGGEFLALALATCYCNDLWREAARLGLQLDAVEVEASASFPEAGLGARDVRYRAWIASPEPAAAIEQLLHATDAAAEVHATLRDGAEITRVATD